MEEIVILIIQFVLEIFGEALLELLFDLASSKTNTKGEMSFLWAISAIATGAVVGGLTLLVFPHSFVHHPWLRYANLVVAPLFSYAIAKRMSKNKVNVNPLVQARLAFLFTLSLAAIRFVFAQQ